MTLAGLAGNDMSKTAVSQIELARIKPTAETLKLIAQRTGKPLSYFLQPGQQELIQMDAEQQLRLEIDELERLTAAGHWEQAAELYRSLAGRRMDDASRAWAGVLGGHALTLAGEPGLAEPTLRESSAFFERIGNSELHAEALERLALAQQVLEDPSCLETTQEALALCRSLDTRPINLEVRLLNRLGSIYDGRNQWEDALKAYELAASRSDDIHDLARMARAFNGLSIAHKALGSLEQAHRYAQRAIAIHEMFRDALALASAENNLGLVLIQLGRTKDARVHLDRALAICDEHKIEQGKAHVLLSLAELDIEDHDLPAAIDHARAALAVAESRRELATMAAAHEALAQALAEANGDPEEIDRHFEQAINLLDGMDLAGRLTACHAKYAQVLEDRGDGAAASKHWRQAVAVSHPEIEKSRRRLDLSNLAGA